MAVGPADTDRRNRIRLVTAAPPRGCLRRPPTANLRFWWIVAVDLLLLAATIVAVLIPRTPSGTVSLALLLTALAVGQAIAIVVAVPLLHPTIVGWSACSGRLARRSRDGSSEPCNKVFGRLPCTGEDAVPGPGGSRCGWQAEAAASIPPRRCDREWDQLSAFCLRRRRESRSFGRRSSQKADRSVGTLVAAIAVFRLAAVAASPWLGPILTVVGTSSPSWQ